MKPHYRLKSLPNISVCALVVFALAGCAGTSPYKKGLRDEQLKDYDTAMANYKAALDHDPNNIDYRLKYNQARFNAAFQHFDNGRRAYEKDDLETAEREFERAVELDPTNDLAKEQLQKVTQAIQDRDRNQPQPPRTISELKEENSTNPTPQSQMTPKITTPIGSFKMTQDSRVIFETLADLAGFNVIFDRDFRGTTVSVNLTDVDIYDALDMVALQTGTFWEPLNKNTILVSTDNQTKRREYEPQLLKTVYLSNSVTSTEITEAITALRTILNMRYIAQSTAMNAIILRDTPDKVAIAEKILGDIDKSKPEVLVEALVLEVDATDILNLGITPPTSTTVSLNNAPAASTTSSTSSTTSTTATTTTTGTTTSTTGTTTTPTAGTVQLNQLGKLGTGSFSMTIPSVTATALASTSHARLIQNPKIRATDGKLASLRIGSKVPVPSGSFQPAFVGATGTPVVQYVYQDIGVNLDITPRVMLNREVSLLVQVQVSALASSQNEAGLELPVFTNRSITHEIRLAEGETNILGGVITKTEQTSLSGIPGLKDIPILRYLFANSTKEVDNTEIIIMLTPHILRLPNITADNLRAIYVGTEANTRVRAGNFPTPQTSAATSPENAPASGSVVPANPSPAPTAPAAPATPATPAKALPPGVTLGTPPAAPTPPPPQPKPTNTTISINPDTITLAAGATTPVNIMVNGNDIFAADLTLSYDPAAVKIQDVRDGGFLSRDGQIVAVVQRIESDSGTARISIERPPGAAPVSGTGPLITLSLQPGARKGDSTIRVIDFRLRDAQQNVYVGRAAEAKVTVP